MNDRSCKPDAADPAHARARLRVAFAAALVAVPLLGVFANAPLRDEIVTHVGLLSDVVSPDVKVRARVAVPDRGASVFADGASATPDHALLDAGDVRRALPVTPQAVAGFESSTL